MDSEKFQRRGIVFPLAAGRLDMFPRVGGRLGWGDEVKYRDPNMEAYFNSLPPAVRVFIDRSGADISTPGELMLIGEHCRNSFGYTEREKK